MEAGGPFDVDSCLERLLKFRQGQKTELTEDELQGICQNAKRIFLDQPVLLELNAPIRIVGDVHGQYNDLLRLFEFGGLPPQSNYVFLGDYVDRGKNGLETICLLLCFKIKYPENFFLLRGNHRHGRHRHYFFYNIQRIDSIEKLWIGGPAGDTDSRFSVLGH